MNIFETSITIPIEQIGRCLVIQPPTPNCIHEMLSNALELFHALNS